MKLDHLKELLKSHGVTQTQLAQVLGRDKSAVTNMLRGKRQLKAQEVVKIAEYLNISEAEVLGVQPESGIAESTRIPFQGTPSAMVQKSQRIKKDGEEYFFEDDLPEGDKLFALEVKDESLNLSGFVSGDIVISAINQKVENGDFVVIQQYDGGGAKTMLRKYQQPFLVPHSTISTYEKLHEDRETVRIVSPIIKVIRILK